MRKTISILLCFAVLFSLCACGASRQTVAVEQIGEESIKNPSSQVNAAPVKATNLVNMEFISDDGLIKISVHDENADSIPSAMPVLRVRPQTITSDMAYQMAKGVFGDAEFFGKTR